MLIYFSLEGMIKYFVLLGCKHNLLSKYIWFVCFLLLFFSYGGIAQQ